MTQTLDYYNRNAQVFFQTTAFVDMAPIYERFVKYVEKHGHILDAGCGSGRDARAFKEMGYEVSAFDASPELAQRAQSHAGIPVDVLSFTEFSEVRKFDGIWACASLLHLNKGDLPYALERLWCGLKPGGVLYVSFKLGDGERIHGERFFIDLNEESLHHLIDRLSNVAHRETWVTEDRRPDRCEHWINGIFKKEPA